MDLSRVEVGGGQQAVGVAKLRSGALKRAGLVLD